jgi:hypothetical protein
MKRSATLFVKFIFMMYLLVSLVQQRARAEFVVGGWYFDPMTYAAYSHWLATQPCGRIAMRQNAVPAMNEMAAWCDSIGLSYVSVEYPDSACFQPLLGHRLKVWNHLTPDHNIYMRAKTRYAVPDELEPWNYGDRGALQGLHGSGGIQHDWSDSSDFYVRADINSLDSHHTFWKPGPTCMEPLWDGWKGMADSLMSMHFRFHCKVALSYPDTVAHPIVARAYWLVRTDGVDGWCSSSAHLGQLGQ